MNLRRMKYWIVGTTAIFAVSAVMAAMNIEWSTKTKGATTVTWTSEFTETDYALGDTVNFTVKWVVDAGAAEYADRFILKRVTPRSRRDPAKGTLESVTYPGSGPIPANSVDVAFTFTDLHCDKRIDVNHGTAHFKLYLKVDKDGDGDVDKRAGFGVNLHVEDDGCRS